MPNEYDFEPELLDNSTNPFRVLRLQSGLSQAQVSVKAGVGTLHVLRAEQGLHSAPPDALLRFFTSPGPERRQLSSAYDEWVLSKRRERHLERFNVFRAPYAWGDLFRASALVAPTSRPSAHATSKLILLQPSLLRRFIEAPADSAMGRRAVEGAAADCGAVGGLVS